MIDAADLMVKVLAGDRDALVDLAFMNEIAFVRKWAERFTDVAAESPADIAPGLCLAARLLAEHADMLELLQPLGSRDDVASALLGGAG